MIFEPGRYKIVKEDGTEIIYNFTANRTVQGKQFSDEAKALHDQFLTLAKQYGYKALIKIPIG